MPTFTFTDSAAADDLPVSDEVNRYNCDFIDQRVLRSIRVSVKGRTSALAAGLAIHEHFEEALTRLDEGWRPISPKRARKLRRRGESVQYLSEFGSNAWVPPHLRSDHS